MYSNLMHKYFKNRSKYTIQPTTEGWGTVLGRVLHGVGTYTTAAGTVAGVAGLKAGNLGGVINGAGKIAAGSNMVQAADIAGRVIGTISNITLKRLLDNPKMKKYLEGQCAKLFKEEQRKDKSITADIPTNVTTLIKRWWHNNDEVGFFSKPNFLQQHDDWIDDLVFDLKVGKYITTFWYDTSHIDAAVVIFYSKNKDTCVGRRIPAPSDKELKRIFYQEL